MRRNAYSGLGRRIVLGAVIVALFAALVAGIVASDSSSNESPQVASTSESTPPVEEPVPDSNEDTDPALVAAVYAFTEAYYLPANDRRNELLKKLCTDKGYEMVHRDPSTISIAEKAAGDITLRIVPGDSSTVQVEPFEPDDNVVSVAATLTAQVLKDDTILQTIALPSTLTSWVKQSDGWRLAYLQ